MLRDCRVASAPGTTRARQDRPLPIARGRGLQLHSSSNRTLRRGRGVSCRTPEFPSGILKAMLVPRISAPGTCDSEYFDLMTAHNFRAAARRLVLLLVAAYTAIHTQSALAARHAGRN